MKTEKLNTQDVVIDFGKYRGVRIQHLPRGYLVFMVQNETQQWQYAEAEMDRRGTVIPQIELSAHSIDTASLRIRKTFHEHRGKNQGLHSWLAEAAWAAYQEKPKGVDVHEYLGVRWVFGIDGVFPMLKTVTPAKKRKDEQ